MSLKIFIVCFLSLNVIYTQSKDPKEILERVKNEFEKVNDYQAEIKVRVDIPFIKMPERNATLYYKQPDKIHIESEGFAMLPKEGINFSLLRLLESEFTAFYERDEIVDGVNAAVIKVIPLNDKSDILLSTLWVDPVGNLILKVESSRKPSGTFSAEFDYETIENRFRLPSSIVFTFSIDPLMFRSGMHNEPGFDNEDAVNDSVKVKTGKVFISYFNYKVNQGIPDSVFEEKK